jgi:D-threo-aldose 1-dehydrogenase
MSASTRVGLGGAPLGNLFAAISDDQAADTVDAAWHRGVRLFDTAPLYGSGLSEQRLGAALADRPRDEYVLSTKVGRVLVPSGSNPAPSIFVDTPPFDAVFDFSRDGVLRSIEGSLERLRTDRVDIVHVHDPDDHLDVALADAFPALVRLRDEGVVGAIGCGMNVVEPLQRVVREADVDVILLAGRYSLLDSSGGLALLPECAERGVEVIVGGVFNSGLLADPDHNETFDYVSAPPALVARARRLAAVCRSHGMSLPAVAIQFALRHRAVTSVVIGARSPAEVEADVDAAEVDVPDELWDELLALTEEEGVG